jgi:hypothetical protein
MSGPFISLALAGQDLEKVDLLSAYDSSSAILPSHVLPPQPTLRSEPEPRPCIPGRVRCRRNLAAAREHRHSPCFQTP